MASMEPSEDEISQVIDFASLHPVDDRSLVTQALKSNSRNVETVVMQYFDNPESFRRKYVSTWDESMFSADREGNNSSGIAFHIESPDHNSVIQGVTPPPDPYAPGAPSRPPSRTNSRSPLGRIVDWTAANATGVPNSQAQEDEDMQRALRESAQEAGITMANPEPSVLEPSASAPHFGPANRNDYDQDNWAMVPVGPSEATTASNVPPPSSRARAPGAPAFLVQGTSSAGNHKLGGVLTILHEIPLARNILLETGSPAATYGHNSEWWKGQEILPPHVLAQLQTGQLQWGQQGQAKTDFEEEIHRLMAFLDSTDRSYGTASVLADLVPNSSSLGAEKQFYEQLREEEGDKVDPMMQVASLAEIHGDDLGSEKVKFGLLEMEHLRSEYTGIKTLYESLDHVMWNDVLGWNEIHESSKMAMFTEMGDVFVIKFGGDGPEDSVEIPEVFYPEKYLTSRKDEARRIQVAWCKTKKEMTRIVEEEQRIYHWKDNWNNQVHDKRVLIKKAAEQWAEYSSYLESLARFQAMEKSGFDTDKYPDYRLAPCDMDKKSKERYDKVDEVIQYSERLLADLEERVKGLNDELERIKARQRFLGRLLTVPDKPGRPQPFTCNKYLLRGVATSTDVVYVCKRAEADLIELDDAPSSPSDQWWRLAYTPNEEQPVKAEQIEIEQLLRDMWQETKTPLLVYATEKAIDTPRTPLTSQLDRFIKAENKAFRQELNQERAEANEPRRATFVDPISPSKRKHRSDSADSMDSNRASLGSDDRNGFDNPFIDQDESAGTEMTEIPGRVINFARSASIDSVTEHAPPLPTRNVPSTGTASVTMTPNTEITEMVEDNEHADTKTDEIRTTTPDAEDESRSPEMQERARPPSFMALSRTTSTKTSPVDMDMEIPEHQE